MPKRTRVDDALVVETYNRLHSVKETAAELGIHWLTVTLARRRASNACVRCGKPLVGTTAKTCDPCKEAVRIAARENRANRRHLGLCALCDKPYELPSRTLCAEHRLADIEANKRYTQRIKRGTPNPGVLSATRRIGAIRKNYGEAAVTVWQKLNGCCAACGASYTETSVIVHHLDSDPSNNVEENFTLLCARCHNLVHQLLAHPNATQALLWFRTTYSTVLEHLFNP